MELLLELGLTVLLSMLFAYFVSELLSMVSDEVDDVKGKQGKIYQRKKRERKNMRLESEDQEVEFVCEPVKVYQIQSDLVRGNLERVDEVFRRVRFNESDETVIKEALEVIKDTGEDDIFMVENLRLKSEGRFEIFTEPAEWDKIQSDKIQSEIVTFSEFCAKLDEEEVKEDNDDLDANEPMSFMKMVENLRLMENLRSEIDGEFVAEPAATGEEELEEEEEDEELEEEEEDEELEEEEDEELEEEEEDEELEEEEEDEELEEEEEEEELEEEEEEELEEEEEEELGFEKANGDFAETIRLMKEEALEGVKALEEEEVKGANGDFGETVRLSENDEIVIKKEALEGVKATGEDILMVEKMRLKSEGRFEFVAEPAELDEIQSDIVTFSEFCAKLEELCGKLKEEKEVKEANGDFGETVRLSENDEIAVKEEALEGVKALEEKEVKEANGDFGETVRLSENDEIAVKEEALEGVKALEEEEVKETNGDFGEALEEEEVKEANGDFGEALEEEEVKEANGDFGETVRLKNDEIAVKEEALEGVKATGEDKLIENIEEEVKEEIKMPAEIEDIGVSENQSDRETEVDGATDEDDWEGIEKSEVANLFAPAAAFVESPENRDCLSKVGSDVRMQLYALHKVAIEGPCHVSQPMALKVSARAKWNAWQQLGNMNPETAMEQYISLLSVSVPGWMGENSGDGSNTKSVEAEAPDVSTSILHGHILETKRPEVHQLSVEKADVIVDPNSSNMVKQ